MQELTAQQINSKRMIILVLSTLALLFLGLIYAFSMFAAPMCQTFGIEKSAIGLTFNIMMIAFCLGCVGGAKIMGKFGVKVTIIIAGIMFAIGFIGTALFANGNVYAVYGFYGICAGAGVGAGYNTIVATVNMWFPDKVGFASGVMMMGFGLSSLIVGTLSVNIANSINNLPMVFIILGILVAVIAILLGMFLQTAPKNVAQILMPEKAAAAPAGGEAYDPADEDEILKSPTFYVYWVWAIIVIGIGLATIGNCASDAQSVGVDAGFATLLVGLVSTFNGCGRLVIGAVYDKTNVKVTMAADAIVATAACACIVGGFALSMPILYIVGALLCGVCYGGVPVVASAFSRQRYGAKKYPMNLSIINFAIVFGSLLNIAVQSATGGDRFVIFCVLLVLAIVALADVLPFSKMLGKDLKELDERKAAHNA